VLRRATKVSVISHATGAEATHGPWKDRDLTRAMLAGP